MDLTKELINLTSEIISNNKLFGLTVRSVPPTDDRVSYQIEIYDVAVGKTYAIQANTKEDITSLLPRLLTALVLERDKVK